MRIYDGLIYILCVQYETSALWIFFRSGAREYPQHSDPERPAFHALILRIFFQLMVLSFGSFAKPRRHVFSLVLSIPQGKFCRKKKKKTLTPFVYARNVDTFFFNFEDSIVKNEHFKKQ